MGTVAGGVQGRTLWDHCSQASPTRVDRAPDPSKWLQPGAVHSRVMLSQPLIVWLGSSQVKRFSENCVGTGIGPVG